MTAPSFVGAGSVLRLSNGNGVSSGTVNWPAGHQAGDVGVLLVYDRDGDLVTTNIAADGWSLVKFLSGYATLYAYTKRATSGSMGGISLARAANGSECAAAIVALRGAKSNGLLGIEANGTAADVGYNAAGTSLTSLTTQGCTTRRADTVVLSANVGVNGYGFTESNGSLSGVSEAVDDVVTSASIGGVLGCVASYGTKLTAGAVSGTSMTSSVAGIHNWLDLMIPPAEAGPYVKAFGTRADGTTSISPAWPAHAADDYALLFVENGTATTPTLATASGFSQLGAVNVSTAGRTMSFTVYGCRATGSSMAAPTLTATDHIQGLIVTFGNVDPAANPPLAIASASKTTTSTSATLPSVTTTANNAKVILALSSDVDASTAWLSSITSSVLSGVEEIYDVATTTGNGGGIALAEGYMESAGATGTSAATLASTRCNGMFTIALYPAPLVGNVDATVTSGQATGGTSQASIALGATSAGGSAQSAAMAGVVTVVASQAGAQAQGADGQAILAVLGACDAATAQSSWVVVVEQLTAQQSGGQAASAASLVSATVFGATATSQAQAASSGGAISLLASTATQQAPADGLQVALVVAVTQSGSQAAASSSALGVTLQLAAASDQAQSAAAGAAQLVLVSSQSLQGQAAESVGKPDVIFVTTEQAQSASGELIFYARAPLGGSVFHRARPDTRRPDMQSSARLSPVETTRATTETVRPAQAATSR